MVPDPITSAGCVVAAGPGNPSSGMAKEAPVAILRPKVDVSDNPRNGGGCIQTGPWLNELRALADVARHGMRRISWRFGRPHPAPIFVLGNQKAGTTAIAALLAARTGGSAMLDIFYRLRDFRVEDRVFTGELSLVDFLSAHRRLFQDPVIKDPSLTFFDQELRRLFPNARFLFVVRDPRDNIRSILNRLDIAGTIEDIHHPQVQRALDANPGWRSILEGRNPPTRGASVCITLARRWLRAAEVYLAQPSSFRLLRYEDFCRDKIGSLDNAIKHLGLEPHRAIGHLVDKPFQPPGDNSAGWEEFYGQPRLEVLEGVCAPAMKQLGYPT